MKKNFNFQIISKIIKLLRNLSHAKVKTPTKSDLELQVKNLLQANAALENSNRKKIKLIESFEGKIEKLERQIEYLTCKETMLFKETQTEPGLIPNVKNATLKQKMKES